MPTTGERFHDPASAWVLEWTGQAWAPLCPADRIAMSVRDGVGCPRCPACGKRVTDVGRE
jgi:hypothetical protein